MTASVANCRRTVAAAGNRSNTRGRPKKVERDDESLSDDALRTARDPGDFSIAVENCDTVARLMSKLNPRERLVVRQSIGFDEGGATYREIGDEQGVSCTRIMQIYRTAIRKMHAEGLRLGLETRRERAAPDENWWIKHRSDPLRRLPFSVNPAVYAYAGWDAAHLRAGNSVYAAEQAVGPIRRVEPYYGWGHRPTDPTLIAWGQHHFEIVARACEDVGIPPVQDMILDILRTIVVHKPESPRPVIETILTVLIINAEMGNGEP